MICSFANVRLYTVRYTTKTQLPLGLYPTARDSLSNWDLNAYAIAIL